MSDGDRFIIKTRLLLSTLREIKYSRASKVVIITRSRDLAEPAAAAEGLPHGGFTP
jgi:hypothetical protein